MKKVLLTGGSGYLAGRIFDFIREEYEVLLLTRNANLGKQYNTANLIVTNWNQNELSEKLIDQVDIIIHTAGMNLIDSARNPRGSYDSNLINTISLIDLIPKKTRKKLIYFSTAHVYSNPLVGNLSENSLTTNVHPYASSHKAAEDYVLYQTLQERIDGVVLRLSNVFGYPMSPNTNCWMLVVNSLCKQAVEVGEMRLSSNGMQYRDFIQMKDLLSAIKLLLDLDFRLLEHRIFNLGGDYSVSIWDMANQVKRQAELILDKSIALYREEKSLNTDNSILLYSIERLKKIGFQPDNNHEKEISQLINFCTKHFSKNEEQ